MVNYLTFDASMPSGPCIKSKIFTKKLMFLGNYLAFDVV